MIFDPSAGSRRRIHACAIVVGERGVLIRGPSGAGKSALSLALIHRARACGRFTALVADDRVYLRAASGRLLAAGVPGYEGLIERRGEGLLVEAHEPRTAIRLVVDLAEAGHPPPRLPEDQDHSVDLLGVRLPRIFIDPRSGLDNGALAALRRLGRDI